MLLLRPLVWNILRTQESTAISCWITPATAQTVNDLNSFFPLNFVIEFDNLKSICFTKKNNNNFD